jgi:multicomponent Na+:H+ antiporter subunit B
VSARARVILFFVGALPLAACLVAALLKLPPSGRGHSTYGDLFVGASVDERQATDVVTAINFDYRGFDTMGEELILFTSVMAVVMLLRKSAEEKAPADEDQRLDCDVHRRAPPTSDAVRVLGLALVGLTAIFGLYIIVHGQLTPGGGFQGGVIVATAWLILYLAGDAATYETLAPPRAFEAVEALGAASYVLVGVGGLVAGLAFLANFLPLGTSPSVTSSGTIAVLSAAVGIEVTAGFVLLLTTFVEEALSERDQS